MIKPLQPKSTSRNPQVRQLRLEMYANGWTPIPCEAKKYVLLGWNKMHVTRELIVEWDRYGTSYRALDGTGIRLDGDEIFVVDIDVSIPELYDTIIERLRARWPDFFSGALERTSGGVTRAFFGRISQRFGQLPTHRYTDDRELLASLSSIMTPEERKAIGKTLKGQKVETFGGGSEGRYFACDGPHSPGRKYAMVDAKRAPWNTRLDSLPVFPFEDVGELVDLCDAILGETLERIPRDETAATGATVYDLTPDQLFITQAGEEIRLEDLADLVERGGAQGTRGCLGWQAWSLSSSKAHCNAFISEPGGRFTIRNFEHDVTHHWESDKPPEPFAFDAAALEVLEAIAHAQAEAPDPEPEAPDPEAEIPDPDP